MESINDSLRDVENKAYDVSKDANQNHRALNKSGKMLTMKSQIVKELKRKLDSNQEAVRHIRCWKIIGRKGKQAGWLLEATGLKGEVISAMQDLEKVYRQLDQI